MVIVVELVQRWDAARLLPYILPRLLEVPFSLASFPALDQSPAIVIKSSAAVLYSPVLY